VISPS